MAKLISPPIVKAGNAHVNLSAGFTKHLASAVVDSINASKRSRERGSNDFLEAIEGIESVKASLKALKVEKAAMSDATSALNGENFIATDHPFVNACFDLHVGAKAMAKLDPASKQANNNDILRYIEEAANHIDSEIAIAKRRLAKAENEAGELMIRLFATKGIDQVIFDGHLGLLPPFASELRSFIREGDDHMHQVARGSDYPITEADILAEYAYHTANKLLDERKSNSRSRKRVGDAIEKESANAVLRDEIRGVMNR